MSKVILTGLAAGVVSGIVFVLPAYGSLLGVLLINFTLLPLFLAGLSMGAVTAAVAAVSGAVVVVAAIGVGVAVPFVIAYAVPAVALVRQALLWRRNADGSVDWYPLGPLLTLIASYGAAVFVATVVLMAGQAEGLFAFTRTALEETLAVAFPSVPVEQRAAAVVESISLFPAMIATSWLLMVVVNGALAQAMLTRLGRNLRPSPRFTRIELPIGLALALAASLALWLATGGTPGYTGKTLTLIFATPYFLQGLAVIHELARRWRGRLYALVALYVALLLLGWTGFALTSGLGFVEHWAGLRRRFAGPGSGGSLWK